MLQPSEEGVHVDLLAYSNVYEGLFAPGNGTIAGQDAGIALARTSAQAAGVLLVSFAIFCFARSHKGLQRAVFAPCAAAGTSGAAGFPGTLGVFKEVQASLGAVERLGAGLEAEMIRRFVLLNLRLLGFASVVSAILAPLYASTPPAKSGNPSDPTTLNVTQWSSLQKITIIHVPAGNPCVLVAGVACFLYSIFYVHALSEEWKRYAESRRTWHERSDGVHHATILVVAEAARPVQAHDLSRLLEEMLGGLGDEREGSMVTHVASVKELRREGVADSNEPPPEGREPSTAHETRGSGAESAGSSGASRALAPTMIGDRGRQPTLLQGASKTVRRGTTAWLWRWMPWLLRSVVANDERYESRFLVLLRHRRLANLLIGQRTCRFTSDAGGDGGAGAVHAFLSIELAPSARDVHWPNLLRSRWRLRARYLLGTLATYALFLFWTIPVTAVQALSSIDKMSQQFALKCACVATAALAFTSCPRLCPRLARLSRAAPDTRPTLATVCRGRRARTAHPIPRS